MKKPKNSILERRWKKKTERLRWARQNAKKTEKINRSAPATSEKASSIMVSIDGCLKNESRSETRFQSNTSKTVKDRKSFSSFPEQMSRSFNWPQDWRNCQGLSVAAAKMHNVHLMHGHNHSSGPSCEHFHVASAEC